MLIPKTALSKLSALRERERLFYVVWGLTRWLALAITMLVIASFIDWRIDRDRETPWKLRIALTLLQGLALLGSSWYWLILPWTRGPALIPLAKRVEKHYEEFDHRLITAIQLSRPNAQTQGMSAQLIEEVTREAEALSQKHRFTQLADTRRLKWSAGLLAWPVAIAVFALIYFGPTLLSILCQRQLMSDLEIPRLHQLTNQTPRVFPQGDIAIVRYEVTGPVDEKTILEDEKEKRYFGYVRIYPDGLKSDDYPVEFERRIDDNHTIFKAQVLQSTVNFQHRAWIGDGRTRDASTLVFEPRPEVTIGPAVVEMPSYVPPKPDGSHYATTFPFGDVKGYDGSQVTVQLYVQKPITDANLILYQRDANNRESIRERLPIAGPFPEVEIGGTIKYLAQINFKLQAGMSGYKGEAWDLNGFASDLAKSARRGIEIYPDQPPVVTLLPERYDFQGQELTAEDSLPGMPALLGSKIPIEYACRSAIGLGTRREIDGKLLPPARIVYRVNEGDWKFVELLEVQENDQSGPFDPLRGSFENSVYQHEKLGNKFGFVAKRSPDLMVQPPRLTGGGRFDLPTDSLRKINRDGKLEELASGDRVEFYVEVFDAKGNIGRTVDTRSVEVRPLNELLEIVLKTNASEQKLRMLTKLQQGTFRVEKTKPK